MSEQHPTDRQSTPPGRRLGVMFRATTPVEELPAFARAAERASLDELWVVEDCFLAGGLTAATTALAATGEIEVGVGLLPAAVRNAAIATMEIASVARLHPGRFVGAFGHGVDAWMRQIGARPPDRLVVLEETVAAVRSLLGGRRLSVDGRHVHLDDVALDQPPSSVPPILVGTTGVRGLRLAGRLADGIVLPEGSGPEAIRWAAREAGGCRVVVYAWLSLDDDEATGLAAIRPAVERWAASGSYPRLAALAGLGEDGSGQLDDDVLRTLAVAGDAAACARAIESLWDAGATSVVLVPRTTDAGAQLARAAAEVSPRLERARRAA